MSKHYEYEDFPSEWVMKDLSEVNFLGWINEKLAEGKTFCCFVPGDHGVINKALFLIEKESK